MTRVVGVVGAGTMGHGIAQVFADPGPRPPGVLQGLALGIRGHRVAEAHDGESEGAGLHAQGALPTGKVPRQLPVEEEGPRMVPRETRVRP